MAFVTTFGFALLAAVLLSNLSARSPLSTSGIFLFAGLLAGPLVLDAERLGNDTVREVASVTLFAVLFADGQRAPLSRLRHEWADPTRALLIGMPLTFGVVAVLAHLVVGLDWTTSMLIGAILAPTDPVFAAALVGRDDVPARLRSLLNIESGLNDGLALPVVLILIGTLGGRVDESTSLGAVLIEVVLGLVLGVAAPIVGALLVRLPVLGVTTRAQAAGPLAVAILLFVLTDTVGANPYIAAFTAGITLASVSPRASESFAPVGELTSELAKNAALLAFGALVTPALLGDVGISGWIFAVLVLVIGRPIPVLISLVGSHRLARNERLSAAWFGPKGFASVVYGLLVLTSGIDSAEKVFALVAGTVIVSIALHSATDTPVAAMLHEEPTEEPITGAR
ncbi:cation:proton antiporter [Williamsia maris]|uniref:Sodium/hydrogen exchanger family protein n=1 Tax=Williamsia maris TaxID=72806 RepID=A0ABT1HD18_9NOCA|nr:cation:proton antiporter [Williamsia maris]MCP2176074.1 Sodium/hydrogen exchanger family protein [Williamsia maris]